MRWSGWIGWIIRWIGIEEEKFMVISVISKSDDNARKPSGMLLSKSLSQ